MNILNKVLLFSGLLFLHTFVIEASVWQSEQKHLGYAMTSGGWNVRYQLGSTQMGMEAQIPIILTYNAAHDEVGMFFHQWHCPQLESSVTPFGKDVMKWVQPSGDTMLFVPDPKDKGNYSSLDKSWRLMFKNGNKLILIFNEQGWVLVYENGALTVVESPTGRSLEFIYERGDLQRVEMLDPDGKEKPLILIACQYDNNHRCVQMEIGPYLHKFDYGKVSDGLLLGWDQPNGDSLNFYYDKTSSVLNEVEKARQDKDGKLSVVGEPLTLKTKYFEPKDNKSGGGNPKRNPANYFIEDDGTLKYEYSVNPNNSASTAAYEVTATDSNRN
jgi:hypothetical protein